MQEYFTIIEITIQDHPNLFFQIFSALADLHCNIIEAHACSYNTILTCVVYVSDQSNNSTIDDFSRLTIIKNHLTTVLRATANSKIGSINNPNVKISKLVGLEGTKTCTIERRLHQLMLSGTNLEMENEKKMVKIESCDQRGYSIVNVEFKDRPRLMFDIVCTLTDLEYTIFHASTNSRAGCAFQVYTFIHILYMNYYYFFNLVYSF